MSVADFIKDLPLALTAKVAAPLFVASTVPLLGGDPVVRFLRVEGLFPSAWIWIGGVWLLSGAVLITSGVGWLWEQKASRNRRSQLLADRTAMLDNLTAHERQLLRPFIQKRTKTLSLNKHHGVVQGLVDREIVRQSSTLGRTVAHGVMFDFNIADWAYDYLAKHSDRLEITD